MPVKFVVVGLRHPHINDVVARLQERDDTELVAVCEEDAATREALLNDGKFEIVILKSIIILKDLSCSQNLTGLFFWIH